jgi:REP element-mobilizing transposase RayT
MRQARIKADGGGYYHGMSRIIERRHILGPVEKERLLRLMRDLAGFGGLEILTYALMSNHLHILVHVPARREVSDAELLQRLLHIMQPVQVELIGRQLREYRAQGLDFAAEALKERFTYRMFDLSEFFKALKQRFSQFYNRREGRCGPLWEQRFKSLLVEPSAAALLTVAAYIDLNAVRAGLTTDPKDYRYGGYGAAVGGETQARVGLQRLLERITGGSLTWSEAQRLYRQQLYGRGEQKGLAAEGHPLRPGFTREQVRQVLEAGGRLSLPELLRCRVRYFSDGLALGGAAFLQEVFERHRSRFGPRRRSAARPMRGGDWGDLCTLRDLRVERICVG